MIGCLATIEADPLADFHSLASHPVVLHVGYWLGLAALPAHATEILLFAAFYIVLHLLTMLLSPLLVRSYRELAPKNRRGFDMHVVSQVNAILSCVLSFPMFFSTRLTTLTSYTPYAGFVVAHAIGYFIWDVIVSLVWYKYSGPGFLAHAVAALFTFASALRPFMLNVGAPFIWFEASTPFVNVNWFASHVPGLISENAQKINGLLLIIVFFLCRIVPGPINGYKLFHEALTERPDSVPLLLIVAVFTCYVTLVSLNFLWFYKMLRIAAKKLRAPRAAPVPSGSTSPVSKTKVSKASSSSSTRRPESSRRRKV